MTTTTCRKRRRPWCDEACRGLESAASRQWWFRNEPWWDPWNSTGKPLLLVDPNWTSIGQLPSSMHHPLGCCISPYGCSLSNASVLIEKRHKCYPWQSTGGQVATLHCAMSLQWEKLLICSDNDHNSNQCAKTVCKAAALWCKRRLTQKSMSKAVAQTFWIWSSAAVLLCHVPTHLSVFCLSWMLPNSASSLKWGPNNHCVMCDSFVRKKFCFFKWTWFLLIDSVTIVVTHWLCLHNH